LKSIPIHDRRIAIKGAVSLEVAEDYIRPWRLQHADIDLYYPDTLIDKAANGAGVRLEFKTDSRRVGLKFLPLDTSFFDAERDTLTIDLEVLGENITPVAFDHGSAEAVWSDLPDGEKRISIWLHQFTTFSLRGIELDDGASFAAMDRQQKRWTTYGSSITHSRDGIGPTGTWPAIVARQLDLDLTCLGFGGQCHLDPIYARSIRDLPADIISLKLGINTYGRSLSARTFRPAVIGFVERIREKHPRTPLVLCSPIFSAIRETVAAFDDEYTLAFMRSEMAEAVDLYRRRGDRHIHYVSGLDIAGLEMAGLMPDDTHPNGKAQPAMASNFIKAIEGML
jgi:hypothetical protein